MKKKNNEFQSEIKKYKDLIRKEMFGDGSAKLQTELAKQIFVLNQTYKIQISDLMKISQEVYAEK